MKKYIGCDAHARYSIFASLPEDGRWDPPMRVEHNELEMLVQAMEEAGLEPRLAHALEAKKRMPGRNKTGHLDAKGLALMLRNGSSPEVMHSAGTSIERTRSDEAFGCPCANKALNGSAASWPPCDAMGCAGMKKVRICLPS